MRRREMTNESDMAKMTRRWQRAYTFQAPDGNPVLHRPTADLLAIDVCSICKTPLDATGCAEHGNVPPMRSAVVNGGTHE